MSAHTAQDESVTPAKELVALPGINALDYHSENPNDTSKGTLLPSKSRYFLFVVCVALHAILISVFVALIGLRYRHNDNPVDIPQDHFVSALLFDQAVVSINSIFKVIWAVLLIVTQMLAFENNLHTAQSLTAMHDTLKTWASPVYKSPLVLFQYRTLFKSRRKNPPRWRGELIALGNILVIVVYLAAGEGLGYLAPSFVYPIPTYGNSSSFQNLTKYIPNIGQDSDQIREAFPVVDILPLMQDNNVLTAGLSNNVVYDVPSFTSAATSFTNGVAFDVTCQRIPGVTQAGTPDRTHSSYPISIGNDFQNVSVSPSSRTLNIRSATPVNTSSVSNSLPVMILASTFPVYDLNNTQGTVVSLTPGVSPTNCVVASDCSTVSTLHVMACNVEFSQLQGRNAVEIDTTEYPPLVYNPSAKQYTESWADWAIPKQVSDSSLSNIGNFGKLAPLSHTVQLFKFSDTGEAGNNTLSILEDNMMEALGYYRSDIQWANLDWVEASLAQAIAAVYWRGATRAWDNLTVAEVNFTPESASIVTVEVAISKTTPWVGLALSILMLILAVYITFPRKTRSNTKVKSTSILEMTWLLGNHHEKVATTLYQTLQSKGEEPSMENLRNAGKDIPVDF